MVLLGVECVSSAYGCASMQVLRKLLCEGPTLRHEVLRWLPLGHLQWTSPWDLVSPLM